MVASNHHNVCSWKALDREWIGIRDRLPRVGEIRDREGTRLDELGKKTRDRTS